MKIFDLKNHEHHVFREKNFILLGNDNLSDLKKFISNKLKRMIKDKRKDFWGTLGRADGKKVNWNGHVHFSKTGNLDSNGATLSEIKSLYQLHPEIAESKEKVVEYCVSFDKVEFEELLGEFKLGELPKIRLTIFLEPTQGAVAFYDHYEGEYEHGKDSEVEYILPEPTKNHTTNRDRLTYIFDAVPQMEIEQVNPDEELTEDTLFRVKPGALSHSLAVKVLLFRRENHEGDHQKTVKTIVDRINLNDKYKLQVFDPQKNEFFDVHDDNDYTIDTSLKTLLLIHGTFSSTEGSYYGLIDEMNPQNKGWLQQQIIDGNYKQVIAFNHPTISEDPQANIKVLKQLMAGVKFKSSNPVDVLTYSRGGLVGKCLIGDDDMQNNFIPVGKVAMASCASGVHYFTAAANIGKYLTYLRKYLLKTGHPIAGIVLGFAQMSGKYFLNLPGPQSMTLGSDSLKEILRKTPVLDITEIQPIVGDWDKSLAADKSWVGQMSRRGLDKIITLICKGPNDWVVATSRQKVMPLGNVKPPIDMKALHTTYFNDGKNSKEVKDILENYYS